MNRKFIVFLIIILLACAGFGTYYFLDKRVPLNPNAVGNSAGNLHNNGLFFEMNDKVYFANSSDNNCLYVMNSDETKAKRLTTMGAKYINGADGFVYFYMDSTSKSSKVKGLGASTNQFGIYRCKADGSNQTCLLRDFCGELQLCGEYLYFQLKSGGGSLNKMKVNKTDLTQVTDELVSPFCYDNGYIFFTGVSQDHNLHYLDTRSGDIQNTFLDGNYFFPVIQDGYIYYMNGDSNYSIWRASLSTGEKELVTSDRADCFTMDRNYIYYSFSNADAPSLRRCNLDGSDRVILFNGVTNSLNLTSKYLYFKVFGDDTLTYHMPLDGSAAPSPFIVSSK
ncbi:DUF5050 domain-containing protein [Butyrivibrio sp. CB08]|uniref:DUF5050 domain-containing protein n=1 Tax=Butyrivibrio sp. CB08 TaxID=2364879 RepID=UPI000EAA0BB0|nr:DUF5050 domain-containing protein [Butyrivibrio sp. CB08]RKM61042.1 DUF5050 domain-containing protein [Butyrivibrio sp. CB08]